MTTPARVVMKPAMITVRCGCRLASRAAASDDARMPPVAAVHGYGTAWRPPVRQNILNGVGDATSHHTSIVRLSRPHP
jgi:hypothetical protein